MNYMNNGRKPKEVTRNEERKMALMKVVSTLFGGIKKGSQISHETAMKRCSNTCDTIVGITDGVADFCFAEDNYCAYDRQERELKELEEKKKKED